jgi:hypothetical protein
MISLQECTDVCNADSTCTAFNTDADGFGPCYTYKGSNMAGETKTTNDKKVAYMKVPPPSGTCISP